MTTRGLAGWTDFTPRGWLNPDFKRILQAVADSRGFKMVSWRRFRIKRIRHEDLLRIKVRRVGRSTQTHFDADRGPLRAQRGGARQRRHGGAVAAVAGPRRPPDHRAARSAHRGCHPRRRNLCRAIRVRRQDRDLPRPLDLRSRAAVGRLGSGAARLRLAAPSARRRYRADPRQRPLADRRLDFESGAQAAAGTPRRRAGAPRDLAVVAGAAGARRYRRQILSQISARADPRDPLSALRDARHRRRRAAAAGPDRAMLRLAVPRQPGEAHPHRDATGCRTNCSGRSCPMAGTSRAIPARWSNCSAICCRCARPLPPATSRRRRRC